MTARESRRSRRFARARPTRPTRTGCASRATGPSSRTATTSASAPLVALTAGEPAGIGPDLCALIARDAFPGRLVILGDRSVIAERARMRSIAFDVPDYRGRDSAPAFSLLALPVAKAVTPGRLDTANARHVLALLDRALAGCPARRFDPMGTPPVQKRELNDRGSASTGHTANSA